MNARESCEEIRCLRDDEVERACALKEEYLPDGTIETWRAMRAKYPELFCALFLNGSMIGVCFGWPFREQRPEHPDKMLLEGIAVISDYAAVGRGSRLLQFWERQVQRHGKWIVTIGSAGGYVEHFYMKNGYQPVQFMIRFPVGQPCPDALRRRYNIAAERVDGDSRVLYVGIDHLDEEVRASLQADFASEQINAIMEKRLG